MVIMSAKAIPKHGWTFPSPQVNPLVKFHGRKFAALMFLQQFLQLFSKGGSKGIYAWCVCSLIHCCGCQKLIRPSSFR